MRQYFDVPTMAHPDDVREWFEAVWQRHDFEDQAIDYFRTLRLEIGTLEAPLGGGYWISESRLVLLRGAQDEAAVHELAHAWWEERRSDERDALMAVLGQLGTRCPSGYDRVAELANVYCNGIPSQADPSSPTGYWRGMLAEDNDHETFAGFCSGVMADARLLPPQLRKFYRGFLKTQAHVSIEPLRSSPETIAALADILVETVASGGSVSFMHPLPPEQAEAFWMTSLKAADAGERVVLGAFDEGRLVGTVTLHLDTPPNQPHRGEIAKMMTRVSHRGRGIASALMRDVERIARERGRTLLTLDTGEEDGAAALYERLGFIRGGLIPDFAYKPHGGLQGTIYYWKRIGLPSGTTSTQT